MPASSHPAVRRIVIVIGALSAGGAERVAATLANGWVSAGREVWLVATFLGAGAASFPLDSRVSLVRLSDHMASAPPVSRPAALAKAAALRRLIREIAPDVVVSFLSNVNVLTITALAGSRTALIVSERTDPAGDIEMSVGLRLLRVLTYPFADWLVVQTAAAARRYSARLPGVRRIAVIRNPLPPQLFASTERAQQRAAGGLIVAMGRLTPSKGFDQLIEVFDEVLGGNAAWRLDIWGEGPLRGELSELISQRHLQGQVRLPGNTSEPWSVLAAAQVFLMPSAYEGFPNAMLEAMALGLPCIAYDCPSGPRELSDGGAAATIVPIGDRQALARALREMVADGELRGALGERAAAFVRGQFALARVMAEWDALFSEVRARTRAVTR